MNQIEERLAEEVRKHEHLYNPYRTDKDPQTAYNSWKVISASVGLEVLDCSTLWRKMRDRFVRQNKAMTGSGDSKATAFYIFLSWLEPHIRHRETSSKYDKPSPCNVATKKGPSLSTSVSRLPSLSARRLAEEVRKHEHLYNPYRKDNDQQTAYNSWKMISASVGLEVLRCSTLWRQMRDRFVRENKAMTGSGDRKATAFYKFLSWLEPHIRHREPSSNYDKPSPCNVATKKGPSLSTPTPEAPPETFTSVSPLPSLSARRLAEEVRKHEHLYNPYRTDKDPQTAYNSWKMISASVGLEVLDCSTMWRKMRDRFVRQNKALRGSGDQKATAFYKFLSWLEPHIRHRETSSKYDKPSPCNVATKKGPSLSTPTPEASVQPSTPTPEASVQPSTPATPEASPETSTSVSPLPSVPALSTPPAAMRLASPLSRRGRKKRQRAQRGKHDRQRWQRGQRGQYDRQRGQDDGQRRQDDRQMIRLDGQRRQDDGQRGQDDGQRRQDDRQMIRLDGQRRQDDGQRGQDDGQRRQDDRQMIRLDGQRRQDDGQMIRLDGRRLDGQKKKMGVRDEYSRFGELVAAMMSRVQEDKRAEAMNSVYSLLDRSNALWVQPVELKQCTLGTACWTEAMHSGYSLLD
ncbi:uncharacterized protein LOC116221899 isoform X2 [Clupea harengus]|uniref:Uncharacterized protein LOC116221899 isoform X2 n=1 Tax=Clupea harengus TaxID=7950 RepID=A0A6P8G369_CLUHA|nr:uncharacterized protein LOC116221899 isoform X2 [Clupea harengus]